MGGNWNSEEQLNRTAAKLKGVRMKKYSCLRVFRYPGLITISGNWGLVIYLEHSIKDNHPNLLVSQAGLLQSSICEGSCIANYPQGLPDHRMKMHLSGSKVDLCRIGLSKKPRLSENLNRQVCPDSRRACTSNRNPIDSVIASSFSCKLKYSNDGTTDSLVHSPLGGV